MDKDLKNQVPQANDEFEQILQGRALKSNENYNIDDFISAPTAKSTGEIENSGDSALGEFIAKPEAEEERSGFIATMHPELLDSLGESQDNSPAPNKKGIKTAIKIIITLVICLSVALFAYFKISQVGNECDKEYNAIYETVLEKGKDRFAYLQDINKDTVGFIDFGSLGYPVVKPQENEEDYYKDHLFSGKVTAMERSIQTASWKKADFQQLPQFMATAPIRVCWAV